MILPRSKIGIITHNNYLLAETKSNTGLNQGTTQLVFRLSVNQHSVCFANVGYIVVPERDSILRRIGHVAFNVWPTSREEYILPFFA